MAHYSLGVTSLTRRERDAALRQYHLLKTLSRDLADKLYSGLYEGMLLKVSDK